MKQRINDLEKDLEDAYKERRELLRRPKQRSPSNHRERDASQRRAHEQKHRGQSKKSRSCRGRSLKHRNDAERSNTQHKEHIHKKNDPKQIPKTREWRQLSKPQKHWSRTQTGKVTRKLNSSVKGAIFCGLQVLTNVEMKKEPPQVTADFLFCTPCLHIGQAQCLPVQIWEFLPADSPNVRHPWRYSPVAALIVQTLLHVFVLEWMARHWRDFEVNEIWRQLLWTWPAYSHGFKRPDHLNVNDHLGQTSQPVT